MEEHQVNQPSQSDQGQEEQKKMIPLEKATAYISWIKEKLELDDLAESVKDMAVYRGQVYWCQFGMGVGYEIQKRRPAVILQCNLTNKRNGNTIVVPITHNASIRISMVEIAPRYNESGAIILDGRADATQVSEGESGSRGQAFSVTVSGLLGAASSSSQSSRASNGRRRSICAGGRIGSVSEGTGIASGPLAGTTSSGDLLWTTSGLVVGVSESPT